MPSDPKYTKKKPTTKPRSGLYKPGEEIKPQRRPSIFQGYPEVKKQGIDNPYAKSRETAGEASRNRSSLKRGSYARNGEINLRAQSLYSEKAMFKEALGKDKSIPKEMRAKGIKKLNRDMNRLTRVMDEDANYQSRSYNKGVNTQVNSERLAKEGKSVKAASAWKRAMDLVRGGYIKPKKFRSPVSPAAVAFEIGMANYKAGQTKTVKKIKKLRKQAVST